MERISRFRAVMIILITALILFLYAARLFSMQIIETKGNTDNTQTYTTLTRVKAARGDITDRNGVILVGNRASYDLVFNHYVIKSADNRNEQLLKLLNKCVERNISYIDHFPITKAPPFEYTLDQYSASWREKFQSFMGPGWCDLDSDISAPLLVETMRERYDIPEEWTDVEARAVIGLRYEFDLRGVTNLSNYVFIEDVSDEDLSALLELNIPGLMVEASTVREYYTKYAAHILGGVGAMDAEEWERYEKEGYAMDAIIGQSGFEAAFEHELHAIDGTRVDVVDKDGTIISQYYSRNYNSEGEVISINEPIAGNNVEITIDIELQAVAEDALGRLMKDLTNPMVNTTQQGLDAEGAAVIVMDVKTGEVLACASYPTFDLATLNQHYDDIEKADFAPLFNRALSAVYPPGSTYKMCTLAAAMENGLYEVGEVIVDKGVFTKYKDFSPQCLLYTNAYATHQENWGTPGLTAPHSLEVSCNYFYYELGDRLNIEMLDAMAKGLGLGEPTGIELPEVIGHRSNPESKAAQYTGMQAQWFVGDRILTAIGQAENRFTPMQLCVYTATLANQGVRMKATFLSRVVSADYRTLVRENEPVVMDTTEISDDTYITYVNGMRDVIAGPEGTGRGDFGGPKDYILDENGMWPYPEIRVCAKTGTAQTFKDRSDNGAYVCFAPMEDPQIAIAIYGERVAHGSTLGVVAEEIMRAYFALGDSGDVIVYENKLS